MGAASATSTRYTSGLLPGSCSMRSACPTERSIDTSSGASGSELSVPNASSASDPTAMPTAIATTMSSGASVEDTTRNTTRITTPLQNTRRHCCETQGAAMITRATAAAISGEVAKAGSVSSTTRRVVGSTAAMTPWAARKSVSQLMASTAPTAPLSRAAAWRKRRRTARTTSATAGIRPAPSTTSPVNTSAKRSGTRWYTSTRSSSAPPIVLRSQVATRTPTPTRARPTMRRTTSAWERTRWRGETDTTTPASTPTCSFSLVTPGGAAAPVLCTALILTRPVALAGDAPGRWSELGQHRVGAAHVDARLGLDREVGHHAVLDDRRVALRAGAEPEARAVHLQAHGRRELAVAVGQHRHGALGVLDLAPSAHDEGVVDGDAGHRVDAL